MRRRSQNMIPLYRQTNFYKLLNYYTWVHQERQPPQIQLRLTDGTEEKLLISCNINWETFEWDKTLFSYFHTNAESVQVGSAGKYFLLCVARPSQYPFTEMLNKYCTVRKWGHYWKGLWKCQQTEGKLQTKSAESFSKGPLLVHLSNFTNAHL